VTSTPSALLCSIRSLDSDKVVPFVRQGMVVPHRTRSVRCCQYRIGTRVLCCTVHDAEDSYDYRNVVLYCYRGISPFVNIGAMAISMRRSSRRVLLEWIGVDVRRVMSC